MRFMSDHLARALGFELACRLLARHGRVVWQVTVAMLIVALFAMLCPAQTVCNSLGEVNRARAARGLYALQADRALQAAAEYESTVRAHRRVTGHLRNGVSPGSAEGVGWRGGRDEYGRQFLTCFHKPRDYTRRYRRAGAATAVNERGQTFYTLILK